MNQDKKPKRNFQKALSKKSFQEAKEIKEIEKQLSEQAPAPGTNPLLHQEAHGPATEQQESGSAPTLGAARKFDELPLSKYSKEALRDAKFVSLTAIQRAALPHALCGRDVLGAAKTGSGKTLAFILPVLEKLYRSKWTKYDGLGALIISPTRELALQIFDELRKVGRRHEFSAGLLIGGKDVKEEQARVGGMNILVCTPGRLLQHMDETPGFDASNLQILVLDEADRILDMGFSTTLNAIVSNIPPSRQTLLFSATQTKSVKDLARLSLKDPEYISVHAEASTPTPLKLQQAYMVCPLQDKMDILWSFIKTHLKAKVIVFVSSCKQVRFLHEAFKKLRPGVPLRALHGRMNQYKRMGVFYEFCQAKSMVLFATDIAARGLDFPTVHWVVQADCPEDVAAYIHRVGRTARYVSAGRALLLLVPSEKEGMLKQLEEAKVPVKPLKYNPAKVQPVTPALQALLSKDQELKEVAQRALISYLRSVFLQPNHAVFDVTALPAAEFAHSMGLPTAPKLRFLKRAGKKMKEVSVGGAADEGEAELLGGGEAAAGDNRGVPSEVVNGAMGAVAASDKKGRGGLTDGGAAQGGSGSGRVGGASGGESEEGEEGGIASDDDLLVVKRRDVYGVEGENSDREGEGAAAETAAAEAAVGSRLKRKKKLRIDPGRGVGEGQRVVFGDDGEALDPLALLARSEGEESSGEEAEQGGMLGASGARREGLHVGVHASVAERAAAARALMTERDRLDKQKLRELRKAMREERKAKRKARETGLPAGGVVLEGNGAHESSDDQSDDSAGQGSEGSDREAGRRGDASASEFESDAEGDLGVDLLDSSDDEGAAPPKRQRVGRNQEAATLGMLPAGPQHTELGAAGGQGGREAGRKRSKPKVAELSLKDQEALALQLLAEKR